ncbi:phage tail tape measure protein, partial [Leptospira brenneri]|uniref:phage tail tape measure protein n=1 Tax=Leptospira brenneri TaxID=2023182 RepID=UPI000C2AAD64
METFELGVVLTLKDSMIGEVKRLKDEWNNLRETLKLTENQVRSIDNSFANSQKWGKVMAWGTAATMGFSKGMITARMETSKLEKELQTLGFSIEDIQFLSAQGSHLSVETGIDKGEILTGFYDLKSAVESLDAAALPKFAESVKKTAIATKGSFADLSKLFGMTYNQYKTMYSGMSDADFGRMVGNTITEASRLYRTDGAAMNQAMNSLGSAAASLNVTFTEQSAVLGRLQNVMNPGEAGTAYRAFLSKIGPGMKSIGLSATDGAGKLKSMPAVLQEINNKFGEIDATNDLPILIKAFGEEGVKTIQNLMPHIGKLQQDIDYLGGTVNNMDFSAFETASETVTENTGAQWHRVTSSIKALGDTFASVTDGPVSGFLGMIADGTGHLIEFVNESEKFRFFAGWVLVGIPPLVALGGAIASYIYFMKAYTAVKVVATAANARYTGSVLLETGAVFYNAGAYVVNKAALMGNTVATYIATSATRAASIARATNIALLGVERTSIGLTGMVYAVVSGKTSLATAAQWAFNTALSANPVGVVIIALVALVAVVVLVINYWEEITSAVSSTWQEHKQLITVLLALSGPIGWTIAALGHIIDNWEAITGAVQKAYIWTKKFFSDETGKKEIDLEYSVGQASSKIKTLEKQRQDMLKAGMGNSQTYKGLEESISALKTKRANDEAELGQISAFKSQMQTLGETKELLEKQRKGLKSGSQAFQEYSAQIGEVQSKIDALNKSGYTGMAKQIALSKPTTATSSISSDSVLKAA